MEDAAGGGAGDLLRAPNRCQRLLKSGRLEIRDVNHSESGHTIDGLAWFLGRDQLISPLAEGRIFSHSPGLVLHCPACGEALLRLIRAPGRVWLDMGGLEYIELATPE